MQNSTTSPSTAMNSTDIDSVASQQEHNTQTAASTGTLPCPNGCPVVLVYDANANWPTISRITSEHWKVCLKSFCRLLPSNHCYDTSGEHWKVYQNSPYQCPNPSYSTSRDTQNAPNPPELAPESLSSHDGNRGGEVIADCSGRRKTEDERKEGLENDQYTEDVQPTSVRCRGCQKTIKLDRRSRYYPGLWDKHRGKCPGILKLEVS
ncbi:hypothetical protein EDB19DRAFT_1728259 [Suillus lakei]|nr:hypothetical protein EDB19DRAFT_1728259 [Suillus lakei]